MYRVAFGKTIPRYNESPPYHPSGDYPELPFTERSDSVNFPYDLCRRLMAESGYDQSNFGKPNWNPLGHLCKPGQTVLLKPNFVNSLNVSGGELYGVVTHPSVLRVALDYAYIALRGDGKIFIADSPQMDCDWNQLMDLLRLNEIISFYRSRFGFEVQLIDLRSFALIDPKQLAFPSNRKSRSGDPNGHVIINLASESKFFGQSNEHLYYGADFDRAKTLRHHTGITHEYAISRTALSADLFISIPKMKVHKKVGVTLNLKGLVGITTDKNYLIHYRLGSPATGGDAIPEDTPHREQRFLRCQQHLYDFLLASQTRRGEYLYKLVARIYRRFLKPFFYISPSTAIQEGGNWYGNDTAWRMVADLYKLILYADSSGTMRQQPQRNFFCLVDGIVGGEKEGPLAPTAKPAGCLVMGENPMAVDLVVTRLMGYDIRKIRQFDVRQDHPASGEGCFENCIEIISDSLPQNGRDFFHPEFRDRLLDFESHPNWKGHIEV